MTVAGVSFVNPSGQRLAGALHHPAAGPPRWGAVIAHGMLSSKGSTKHLAVASLVAELGGAALRFDFAGRGESEGDPTDLTITAELADLGAAVAWMRDRIVSSLALVGSSLGGAVAMLHASSDPAVTALVTVASPSRLPDRPRAAWGGPGLRRAGDLVEVSPGELIRARFFTDAARHDPLAAAARVACPWLILHGTDDDVVPFADGEAYARAAPRARFVPVSGADHRSFADRHLERLLAEAGGFLRTHLLD